MQVDTYELDAVRNQYKWGAGIFGCNEWVVFSDTSTWVTMGPPKRVDTWKLPVKLAVKTGKDWEMTHSYLNTDIFIRAWKGVIDHNDYKHNDWIVKVDPDAVFLANRLKYRLSLIGPQDGNAVYIKNCDRNEPPGFGMYGAVEILSEKAASVYLHGLDDCQKKMDWKGKDMGWHGWGEDYFLQKCLDQNSARPVEDLTVLKDSNCFAKPSPCTTGQVAFHPFKSSEKYKECLEEARR